MNRFFDDLGERWVAAAGRRSAQIEAPTLDAELALELLELARVAARTQERRFAPLACYLAGVAARAPTSGPPSWPVSRHRLPRWLGASTLERTAAIPHTMT